MNFLYFNNILISSNLDEIIHGISSKIKSALIEKSTLNGANFKKLKGYPLYSMRLSKSSRLLFLKVNGALILVDKFEQHSDYDKKLNQKNIVQQYLKRLGIENSNTIIRQDFSLQEWEGINVDEEAILKKDLQELSLENIKLAEINLSNVVVFSEQQKSVCIGDANLILGVPGSGKTSVAVKLCEEAYNGACKEKQYAQSFDDSSLPEYSIAYITENPSLAKQVDQCFDFTRQEITGVKLYSYDYESFIVNNLPELRNKTKKTKRDFIGWCMEFFENKDKNLKSVFLSSKDLKKNRGVNDQLMALYEAIYEEFKVLCVGSQDDYINLGRKSSIIANTKDKKICLYQLYQKYTKFLGYDSYDLCFLDINSIDDRALQKHNKLYVDESQVFSRTQLNNLFSLVINKNDINFLGDNHQNIHGTAPFDKFIESLWVKHNVEGKKIIFSASYRIPPAVLPIADGLLRLKNYCYGCQSKDNYLSLSVSDSSHNHGQCAIYRKDDQFKKSILNELIKLCKGTKTAVVVCNESDISKAMDVYDTPLVFTAEQILGQEYDVIIVDGVFSDKSFRAIEKYCSQAKNYTPTNHFSKSTKQQKISEVEARHLNTAFVAITRAQKNLYIVHDSDESVIIEYLKDCLNLKDNILSSLPIISNENFNVSNVDDWKKKQRDLVGNGFFSAAKKISETKLVSSKDAEDESGQLSHLNASKNQPKNKKQAKKQKKKKRAGKKINKKNLKRRSKAVFQKQNNSKEEASNFKEKVSNKRKNKAVHVLGANSVLIESLYHSLVKCSTEELKNNFNNLLDDCNNEDNSMTFVLELYTLMCSHSNVDMKNVFLASWIAKGFHINKLFDETRKYQRRLAVNRTRSLLSQFYEKPDETLATLLVILRYHRDFVNNDFIDCLFEDVTGRSNSHKSQLIDYLIAIDRFTIVAEVSINGHVSCEQIPGSDITKMLCESSYFKKKLIAYICSGNCNNNSDGVFLSPSDIIVTLKNGLVYMVDAMVYDTDLMKFLTNEFLDLTYSVECPTVFSAILCTSNSLDFLVGLLENNASLLTGRSLSLLTELNEIESNSCFSRLGLHSFDPTFVESLKKIMSHPKLVDNFTADVFLRIEYFSMDNSVLIWDNLVESCILPCIQTSVSLKNDLAGKLLSLLNDDKAEIKASAIIARLINGSMSDGYEIFYELLMANDNLKQQCCLDNLQSYYSQEYPDSDKNIITLLAGSDGGIKIYKLLSNGANSDVSPNKLLCANNIFYKQIKSDNKILEDGTLPSNNNIN